MFVILLHAETTLLKKYLLFLTPLELAASELNKEYLNLLKCEVVIMFLFEQLSSRNNFPRRRIFDSLKKRIPGRRNVPLIYCFYFFIP